MPFARQRGWVFASSMKPTWERCHRCHDVVWSHWLVNSVPGVLHFPFQVFFSMPRLNLGSFLGRWNWRGTSWSTGRLGGRGATWGCNSTEHLGYSLVMSGNIMAFYINLFYGVYIPWYIMVFRGIYYGISWYILWYNIRYILLYIDVYCHNAIRVTPKQTGSAAGSVIWNPSSVSTQGAFCCRPHTWGRDEALGSFKHSFVFTNLHLFHHVSSVSAFSVGESGLVLKISINDFRVSSS